MAIYNLFNLYAWSQHYIFWTILPAVMSPVWFDTLCVFRPKSLIKHSRIIRSQVPILSLCVLCGSFPSDRLKNSEVLTVSRGYIRDWKVHSESRIQNRWNAHWHHTPHKTKFTQKLETTKKFLIKLDWNYGALVYYEQNKCSNLSWM